MAKRITVVISQGQSAHPAKRRLEEDIVTALLLESGFDVTVIPHLYDLKSDGTGMLALQGTAGDMIVLSWLFERAARWTLDRHGIRGQIGRTLLVDAEETDDSDEHSADAEPSGAESSDADSDSSTPTKARVADQRSIPSRRIYCIDLRVATAPQPFLDEIKRIATECRTQLVSLGGWLAGEPPAKQLERFLNPTNDTALPLEPNAGAPVARNLPTPGSIDGNRSLPAGQNAVRIVEEPDRRWYPVIDFSRCTNCMECIDFCLFGVYGIDQSETILVEQPDNCRKGCPACSRVCPENAIIFPQHKTPAIAGAPIGLVSLKIDLSKLFGAPDEGKSPEEIAALERDEQLILSGRNAVGMSVGIPKRRETKPGQAAPKDDLDSLLDALDDANL